MRKSRAGVDIRTREAGKKIEYIIRRMSVRVRAAALTIVLIAASSADGLRRPVLRQAVPSTKKISTSRPDGSADLIVNASIPALVSLRGLPLDADPAAQVDRNKIRARTNHRETKVTRVSRPWRRDGRRFVQVRVRCRTSGSSTRSLPFSWSQLCARRGDRTARLPADDGRVGVAPRDAAELRLEGEGAGRDQAAPAQPDRRSQRPRHRHQRRQRACSAATSWRGSSFSPTGWTAGPSSIEVRMDRQSILYTTLVAVRRRVRRCGAAAGPDCLADRPQGSQRSGNSSLTRFAAIRPDRPIGPHRCRRLRDGSVRTSRY